MSIDYGMSDQRKRVEYSDGADSWSRKYFGDYEKYEDSEGAVTEVHYIQSPAGLVAAHVVVDGVASDYGVYQDYLGSIMALTDETGALVYEQNFDAWGRHRSPDNWVHTSTSPLLDGTAPTWLSRGYTGHEHLDQFQLINMNGRCYDPMIGRMLSVDNYVQNKGGLDSYNRYAYAMNNPLRYTDPDGEFVVSLIAGMVTGAISGAGIGAASYSISALLGQTEWSGAGFGRSVAMGAIGGVVGGGLGVAAKSLGNFGQSLGYNLISNGASYAATSAVYGEQITMASLAGSAVGALAGASIGNFNAVKGKMNFWGGLKNVAAEMAFKSGKGALTGGISGYVSASISGGIVEEGFINEAKYGAIGGLAMASLNNVLFGPAYRPSQTYGDFGRHGPVYRQGHFLWPKSAGLALGRNLITRHTGDSKYDEYLNAHETGHYYQQNKIGIGELYRRSLVEYRRHGQEATYDKQMTLEFGANSYSLATIGYFYSHRFHTYIDYRNFNQYYQDVP